MKNQWSKDPDRIAYYEHEKTKGGLPAIDEMVIHNANVHFEQMDDSHFFLLVDNDEHCWYFSISSHSGRAKIDACLYDDEFGRQRREAMRVDGKCSYCNTIPAKKTWESPDTFVDNSGNIKVKEPIKMVTYTYYECECGMRHCSEEIEGKIKWDGHRWITQEQKP